MVLGDEALTDTERDTWLMSATGTQEAAGKCSRVIIDV